jgi:hypothetical protein
METVLNIIAPVVVFVASLMGFGGNYAQVVAIEEPRSVEIGLSEVSPKGEAGGFAMPASGCSAASPTWHGLPVHDCATFPDITVSKPIIRIGDPVTVSWDPRTHTNCVLSSNVTSLTSSPNPSTPPVGTAIGSRIDNPTGETIYTITCDGVGNYDTAAVKVLPRIQET